MSIDANAEDFRALTVNVVRTVSSMFKYERVYGEKPSNITNQAWKQLFPDQGGFFKHPDLAPRRSALSVFHQLHCLVNPEFALNKSSSLTITEWYSGRILDSA